MFKYKWKCFIVRPPFLHWLLPSSLYNICLFPSFPAFTLLLVSLIEFFSWHLSFDYILAHFLPKASPGSSKSSIPLFKTSVPTGLLPEERSGLQTFHTCKSFRTNFADSVSDLPQAQLHHRTTPYGTFPPITFQLSENEHQKPPWKRKEKEEVSQKGSLRPLKPWGKIEIRTVSDQATSSRCIGKSPFAKFSSCFHVVIPYAKILYSPTVLPIHCHYFRVDLEKN